MRNGVGISWSIKPSRYWYQAKVPYHLYHNITKDSVDDSFKIVVSAINDENSLHLF